MNPQKDVAALAPLPFWRTRRTPSHLQMEVRMSLLSSLTIVQSDPKSQRFTGIAATRQKLIDRINDQIALAKAEVLGETFLRKRFRRIRDSAGDVAEIPSSSRVRPWWSQDQDGSVLLTVKYGSRPLELQKGKTAIRVATPTEIPATLEIVRAAVRAGEFDNQITAAVDSFRQRFKK
jgi:hypothetical protein